MKSIFRYCPKDSANKLGKLASSSYTEIVLIMYGEDDDRICLLSFLNAGLNVNTNLFLGSFSVYVGSGIFLKVRLWPIMEDS